MPICYAIKMQRAHNDTYTNAHDAHSFATVLMLHTFANWIAFDSTDQFI